MSPRNVRAILLGGTCLLAILLALLLDISSMHDDSKHASQDLAMRSLPPQVRPPSNSRPPSAEHPFPIGPLTPQAHPPTDPFADVDRILDGMELGSIAFNVPRVLNLEDTALIQLLLGLDTSVDELETRIKAVGEKEGSRIRISDRMEARLSGPDFAITAVTPEVQAISRVAPTEWEWEVKPQSIGQHRLHLTISLLIIVAGQTAQRTMRTFDRQIEVRVTWRQRARLFVRNNWKWFWAAILVPGVGWLWSRRRRGSI